MERVASSAVADIHDPCAVREPPAVRFLLVELGPVKHDGDDLPCMPRRQEISKQKGEQPVRKSVGERNNIELASKVLLCEASRRVHQSEPVRYQN